MTSTQAIRVPARYYLGLIDWLDESGFDTDQLLHQSHIHVAAFRSREGGLSLPQVDALVEHALKMTGRADLGMDVGQRIKISTHEILGYAILSSPTLDYALQLINRFSRLVVPNFRARYRRGPARAEFEWTPTLSMSAESLRFHLDTIAVATHEHICSLLGKSMQTYSAYLSAEEPRYAARFRRYHHVIWHFEAPGTPGLRMVLPASMVDTALVMADRHALEMAEGRCQDLLDQVEQSVGLTGWLEVMLRESRNGMPSLGDLAAILNLTPRTLERRLKAENCQFHELCKRIRYQKAREMLLAGTHSITQVALELGYSDLANFTRAFKRESGKSPREFVTG